MKILLFFIYLKECSSGYVTFGGLAKEKVLGKGNIIKPDLIKLQDVILAKGLLANLISINQLCDQGFHVSFSKDKCEVLDRGKNTVTSGT